MPSQRKSKAAMSPAPAPALGGGSIGAARSPRSIAAADPDAKLMQGFNLDACAPGGQMPSSMHEVNIVAAYKARFREDPMAFLHMVWAYGAGVDWRSYKDYIGAPILYPSAAVEAIHSLVMSEAVQLRINQLATARIDALLPDNVAPKGNKEQKAFLIFKERKRAEMTRQLSDTTRRIAETMIARLDSLPVLKLFAAMVNNILGRLYHQGIHISIPEIIALRQTALKAAEKKQSIVFLPCHKSHIDYLTVSWLMFRVGVAVPHIVAGDNLDMPLVGDFLRKGGAMFIRRSFKGDELYPVVIREYIEQILATGRNLECFIEGTRSRTGKLLPPKFGILSYIVEGFLAGRTSDVWICPVSLQYDSVIESETYVSELLGKPKESESLMGLLSGSSDILQLKMGRIDIRFQQPWSLREFVDAEQARRTESEGAVFQPETPKDRHVLLKSLGYRVLGDINRVSVIMPAALVGTVILTLRGRGVGKRELVSRVERLRQRILEKGYRVAHFGTMSTSEVVDRALGLMKNLIVAHNDLLEPTFEPVKRFDLSLYRNQTIHCFVCEVLLAATLYTTIKQVPSLGSGMMPRQEFLEEVSFLSWIMKNEFIFPPGRIEDTVEQGIKEMVRDRVLTVAEDGAIGLTAQEIAGGRETFDSYLFMVWPFIEGYWLAACALLCLMPSFPEPNLTSGAGGKHIAWVSAKEFEKRAQLFGKTLYQRGELSYLEANSIATLQQALVRYQEMGMIVRRSSRAVRPIALIGLHPDWKPQWEEVEGELRPRPMGRLWDYLARLGAFRREGKDRRETFMSQRILQNASGNTAPIVERTPWPERPTDTLAHM